MARFFSKPRGSMRILEEALTFDDVLLVPARSDVLPREVNLFNPTHSQDSCRSAGAVGGHGYCD